jgi:transposase-like protein
MTIKCPKCGSEETVKRGFSMTEKRGKQQRRLCNDCKHTFIVDMGFWKMKNKKEVIVMCVDMYLSNLSSRKMMNQLKRHFSISVSHMTILRWVRKYVEKVSGFVKKIKPKLFGGVYADETEITCGKRNDVFWCAVNWETRLINASLYSPRPQNMEDAIDFMRMIAKNGRPTFIQTDALQIYPRAFRKVFYSRYSKDFVEHRINNYTETKKHNVRIETVFSKIKDRVKDFRGFKSSYWASVIMEGIVIQHNFIEKHSTTGFAPCDLAGYDLNLGDNRWMDLIRKATIFCYDSQ